MAAAATVGMARQISAWPAASAPALRGRHTDRLSRSYLGPKRMSIGETAALGVVSLFVRVVGEQAHARPLLMIHGGPDWDHSYFLSFAEPLAAGRQLILPDLRGCGRSTRFGDARRHHVRSAAGYLVLLLDHLAIPKADVLGFSFGGRVAIQLAKQAPDRVAALVLASASAYEDSTAQLEGWDEYRARYTPGLRRAREALFADPKLNDEARSRELAYLTASLDMYDSALVPVYRRDVLSKIRFSGEWMQAWRSGVEFNTPLNVDAEWGLQALPVLIIHGEKDMRHPVSMAHRLHSAWSHSELMVLPGAGHVAHIEAPQEWCRAVDEFLRAAS